MVTLLINARVVSPDQSLRRRDGAIARAGNRSLIVHEQADVVLHRGIITDIVPAGTALTHSPIASRASTSSLDMRIFDCQQRVLMPGFVDCHTHACFAGERLSEWEQKLAGVPYLDILKAGGGIHSTVRATRAATQQQLETSLRSRLLAMRAHGSTTIEVKTGYGLLAAAELHMLRAILACSVQCEAEGSLTVLPTALLGHALDPSMPPDALVASMCNDALPAAIALARDALHNARARIALQQGMPANTSAASSPLLLLAVDSYIEQGAWSLEQCAKLYRAAHAAGLRTRCHADQFTSQGIVQASIDAFRGSPHTLQAPLHTLDHLEATDAQTLEQLATTPTIPVLLPCTGFHTDQRYANARALLDAGGTVAIATNYNPGSSPCFAMPMAIALAVRCNKMTIPEALCAATVNAAAALGLQDRGCIAPGQRADLVLLHSHDERSLAYEFGGNPVACTLTQGVGLGTAQSANELRS